MRSEQHAGGDADDTVPALSAPAPQAWRHTGDGVVFYDTAQRRRELARASVRRRRWAALAVVLSIIVLGATTAVALDGFPHALAWMTSA